MLHLLLLDNYDSFTWNLAHYLQELGADVTVRLNDELDCDQVVEGGFDGLVLSPGPGGPASAGISVPLVRRLTGRMPILGVCLGQQAIAFASGARIVPAPTLVHGKTSAVRHDGSGIYRGVETPFDATRYHSLVVDRASLSEAFTVNAWTDDGVVMGLRHRRLPIHGLQFHPESILTLPGKALLLNFLRLVASHGQRRPSAA